MPRKKIGYKEQLNELSQKTKERENKIKLNKVCANIGGIQKRKLNTESSFQTEKNARKKDELGYQIQNKSTSVPKTHYSKYHIGLF